MKYKKGDRFIIEIDEVIPYGNDKNIYQIKAGSGRLGMLTQQTLDRLEMAQEHDGCIGCEYVPLGTLNYPCVDCKQNYTDMWTPKTEEIQVGDEVEHKFIGCKAVVYRIEGDGIRVIGRHDYGPVTSYWTAGACTRTGKTYPELIKALAELPKEGE